MGTNSKIEWTDRTWTPIVGCEAVSPACANCYAATMAARLEAMGQEKYTGLATRKGSKAAWTGKVTLWEEEVTAPLRRRKPTRWFLTSMGDAFHPSVPDSFIDRLFAVMARAPQHTFMVLTKRPERAPEYLRRYRPALDSAGRRLGWITPNGDHPTSYGGSATTIISDDRWPLPNVWFGTTVENQEEADRRIPHLLATLAAVRFLSCEPLLGPVDLTRVGNMDSVESAFPDLLCRIQRHLGSSKVCGAQIEAIGTRRQATTYYQTADHMGGFEVGSRQYPRLDWVICGGESGPKARPMHPDWARSLRDQCVAAGVPFFFKQWGEWSPHYPSAGGDLGSDVRSGRVRIVHPTGQSDVEVSIVTGGYNTIPGSRYMARVGKKAAGRLLNGRTWDEMPAQLERTGA